MSFKEEDPGDNDRGPSEENTTPNEDNSSAIKSGSFLDDVARSALADPEIAAICNSTVSHKADEMRTFDEWITGKPERPKKTPTPPPDMSGDVYQKRVWAWIHSNVATQAAASSARNPRQFGSSRRAFQYALGAGIDLDEVEAVLKQAQIDNGAVRDNGEWKCDDTFRRARQRAEQEGPEYLDDRDRPNWYGADSTLTDANGVPIVDPSTFTQQEQQYAVSDDPNDETIRTVPWPVLNPTALHGTVGEIVNLVAPHTEADPAALLAQFLTVFGATLGCDGAGANRAPHINVGNRRHPPILAPVVVGKTSIGAKGTGLDVVMATVRHPNGLPGFIAKNTTSGLSSDAGLIERVRDGIPADEATENTPSADLNGVPDKRLLVTETEFGLVLARARRENNPLSQVLRQCWDGDDLRVMNRKANRLTATAPHIAVIGHITPGEFRATLRATDFSGGSVNRLLICLSRLSRLHPRFGNVPESALSLAALMFKTAHENARGLGELKFTERFWTRWDKVYPALRRDRPDSYVAAATSRAVPMILRLSMIYALFDGHEEIDVDDLEAALALWAYCEDSTRWLFSSHEAEEKQEAGQGLAKFIADGGRDGRTRTDINAGFYQKHKSAAEISAELAPLIHDGTVVEVRMPTTGGRPTTRYLHRNHA